MTALLLTNVLLKSKPALSQFSELVNQNIQEQVFLVFIFCILRRPGRCILLSGEEMEFSGFHKMWRMY